MYNDLAYLQHRVKELEALEREHNELKNLLAAAANNENLDPYGAKAILYVDKATGHILDTNIEAIKLLGYSLEEICALTIDDIETLSDETKAKFAVFIYNDNEAQVYSGEYRHSFGYQIPVAVYRRALILENGQTILEYTLEAQTLQRKIWYELHRREDNNFHFREKLKNLNEINLQLSAMSSIRELCRKGIILGQEKLGFDRLSIWLWNRDARRMVGTYGTDETGAIRDEHATSWSYGGTYIVEFIEGTKDYFVIPDNAPIYNHISEVIGYGWHISVPLMKEGQFIGFMSADNLLNQLPLSDYQLELLRIYGVTLGHLVAHQLEQDTIRKLSNAVQHSNSMIAVLNEKTVIEFVNPAFLNVSGYTREELIGKPLSLLMPEIDYPGVWKVINDGVSGQEELIQRKKNGETYEAIVSISRVATDASIASFVLVQEDITELKQARKHEFDLKLEQERNRILATFVRDIGHEFRTPLSVIQLKSYLIQKVNDQTQRDQLLEEIEDQSKAIVRLVESLTYIVKLESDFEWKFAKIDVIPLIDTVLTDLAQGKSGKNIHWNIDLHPSILINGDAKTLSRAFHELIKNAMQFTPDHGTITISSELRADKVYLQVRDTGAGISGEAIDKIFNRLYRDNPARTTRGAGLGLSIAKIIIEAHQGAIVVESVLNEGSMFEIQLPLMQLL